MPEPEPTNVQEPQIETPPDTKVAEEDIQPQGTPANANPEGAEPEPPAKDNAQLKESAAYFQAESQKAKAELAAIRSNAAPAIQPQPAKLPVAQEQQPQSREELNELLQNDPLLGYATVASHITGQIDQLFSRKFAEIERRGEEQRAQTAFNNFCTSCKVTAHETADAEKYVEELGLKGLNMAPSAIKSLMVDRINMQRMTSGVQTTATEAAAKAAQAAKQQALLKQPDGGAPPQPGSKPTTIDKAIAAKYGISTTTSKLENLAAGKMD